LNTSNFIHISLGSNIGDRLHFLQKALIAIYERVGDVVQISPVYQTPAWGFKSDDFYNACISVTTFLSTSKTLEELLLIEKELGRKRNDTGSYQARTVDLDIIYSSEGIIDTDALVVPHPELQNRKFVLVPLLAIAAEAEHPIFEVTTIELLQNTSDTVHITELDQALVNPKDSYNLSRLQYLSIEGNIGAGKTSLANLIAGEFNAKLVLERFAHNPFLPKFYEDMERYAFSLEMSFLADRYQRLNEDIAQFNLFKDFVVSDYDVFKSLIFAKVTLQEEEFALYKRIFDMMYRNVVKPGLYLYLNQSTDQLLQNIKKRGRGYEQNIQAKYLDKINKGYLQFMKSQSEVPVKIIDVSEKNFIANRVDYISILKEINQ